MSDFAYSPPERVTTDDHDCGTQNQGQVKRKRKSLRRWRGRKRPNGLAKITYGTHDGESVAFIPLFGVDGEGRFVLVDAEAAPGIIQEHGIDWCLNQNGQGQEYVRKGGKAFAKVAGQKTKQPTVTLARLICGATGRQRVGYRNGNRLDLRRSNLAIEGAGSPAKKRGLVPRT
jgi:hypothetical protein